MGHCFSKVVVVVKKNKKKNNNFFFIFLIGKQLRGIGRKVAIFDLEWGLNSAPREGQKIPCKVRINFAQCQITQSVQVTNSKVAPWLVISICLVCVYSAAILVEYN